MNRASPALLRSALQAAHEMTKAGIMFVPMPVADEDEKIRRANEANERLEQMARDDAEPATKKEE